MEGAGRKTVFRTELRLKFVTSPVVKQVPGVGRMTAQLRQLKFQSHFFSPQIKHKVYLSLVRRLEGHSSQSYPQYSKKKQEVSDQLFGSQPNAVTARVLNKNVVS